MSRYQRDVAGPVMKVLGKITDASSSHRRVVVGTGPTKIFPYCHPGYLVEDPCDMRESQHEPMIEIGDGQEALKFSECGWG
jgi:hypothetical protein